MKNTKPNFNKIDRLINEKLKFIYRDEKLKFNVKHYSNIILDLIQKFQKDYKLKSTFVSEKTILLISYGDNLKVKNKAPLKVLKDFFEENFQNVFETVSYTHLTLPTTPYV